MAIFMIRCVDQDELGRHRYWNSKANKGAGGWVPDRIDATTYTQNQRDRRDERDRDRQQDNTVMPDRGMWERVEVTPQSFAEHIERCLEQAVRSQPDLYFYTVEAVPQKARAMVEALKEGNAQVGPTTKRVAKAMGIKPTAGSIQSFLNGGEGDVA